jgi:hypothetical protein
MSLDSKNPLNVGSNMLNRVIKYTFIISPLDFGIIPNRKLPHLKTILNKNVP